MWDKALGIKKEYLDVGGIKTHCLIAGSGPPLVLLHGVGSSVVAWTENLLPLAEHFTVYALDLPGHGDSEKPEMAYTLPAASRFMTDFLDAIDAPRAHLAGESLGGLITLKTALDHPDRVDKVVAIGSAGLGRDLAWVIRWISVPIIGEIIVHPTASRMKYQLKRVMRGKRYVTDELIKELYRARVSPGAERALLKMVRWGVTPFGLRRRAYLLPELPRLQAPLMLVWGANDSIAPVHHAYEAVRISPAVRLEVFEQCGHWAQMEQPERFNRLVREFLLSPPPVNGARP
ncbi:MAG: alpha/beta fold hydrolase [Dehalococcoidia bacterium]|nr:alpha/beta fold hydrolase [Dehalococcoidia bacterium]